MFPQATLTQWILGIMLIFSAIGVVSLRRPMAASLSFLFSLVLLASFYLQLSSEFIAMMQILVYAGAILVIFVFVIVLFQDAHQQIDKVKANSSLGFIAFSGSIFFIMMALFLGSVVPINQIKSSLPERFGSAEGLGEALYLDFFFPFEAVILLFLVAIVGALFIAKREK